VASEYDLPDATIHDDGAEQAVLGVLLAHPEAIVDIRRTIAMEDFYKPMNQIIFKIALQLDNERQPIEPRAILSVLNSTGEIKRIPNGAAYLSDIFGQAPPAASVGYYVRLVKEASTRRYLNIIGIQLQQRSLTDGEASISQILEQARGTLDNLAIERLGSEVPMIADVLPITLDGLEKLSKSGVIMGVPTGFVDLDKSLNGLQAGQMIVIAARPGVGKALSLDTELPTPTGWTTMGDLQEGDLVIGRDGKPTKVVAATEVMFGRPCYEIEFSDGSKIKADEEHLWFTETHLERKRRRENKKHKVIEGVRNTKELFETLLHNDGRLNHAVRVASPLNFSVKNLPIYPYVLGAWLGDGTTTNAGFTSADEDILNEIVNAGYLVNKSGNNKYGYRIKTHESNVMVEERVCSICLISYEPITAAQKYCSIPCAAVAKTGRKKQGYGSSILIESCSDCGNKFTGFSGGICQKCKLCKSFQGILRDSNLLGNKHIPIDYLRASIEQRKSLLAGLLDTDGTTRTSGLVEFDNTNKKLIDGVFDLVIGLGYRATITQKRVLGRTEASSISYRITFTPEGSVFKLSRKEKVRNSRGEHSNERLIYRYIKNISKLESIPVRCIQVDNKDHSYLAGRTMIPTHNSSLAMDIARHAAFRQDKSVIVFSLEMSAPELVMRMLSAEAYVDSQALRTGDVNDEIWQKLAKATNLMSGSKLAIDDTATVTISEIRAKARAIQRLHGLDLIVIDYLQLMNADNRSGSRQEDVSDMSRGVKLLAKEFKIPVVVLSQLNRGPEQRQDKRPVISDLRESGCMTGDTQLLRSDNGSQITFNELMTNGFDNVMVWSIDDKRKMVSGKITNVFASGIMETYLLKLASGKEVKASGNHKFFTFGGWKPLEELEIGEKLAIPRTIPINSESKGLGWNEYRLGLLGHLLGDGCVLKGAPLHYTNGDEANLSFVEEAALSEFCITPRRDKPGIGNWENVYLPSPHPTGHGLKNPIQIWFDDMNIADLRSYEKRIPTILFQANKLETAVFLKHLFATDGGVWHGGKVGAYKIHYSSSSRELIDGVALLISRFGIVGRIKKVKYKNSLRPGYQLSISNIPDILTFANEIGIHGLRGEQLKSLVAQIGNTKTKTWIDTLPVEIWHLIESERKLKGISRKIMMSDMGISSLGSSLYKSGISRERLERVANSLDSNLLREYIQDDIFWDKVVAIEPLGPIEVYDATVEENHNFIANGIVAKNSIEQDADVVILLHREEMHEKESPRAGEADVIIAKQRSGPTGTIALAWQAKYTKFANLEI